MHQSSTRPAVLVAAFMLALFLSLPVAAKKPVKVYILSGQSNMVGYGQVDPTERSRFSTYTSDQPSDENQGCIVSIYAGAYDAAVDYDQAIPVETHTVRIGYWPHGNAPSIDGEQTQVARGFIRIVKPGRYSFESPANGSLLEIDGKVLFDSMRDKSAAATIARFEPGVYPVKITYAGVARTTLSFKFYDVPGSLHSLVKEQGKYQELLDENGGWASRDDVWYKGVVAAQGSKWLTVGCGQKGKSGPELGFGWALGDYHDEPVLILKASKGNRSLAWDFLPPGSERFKAKTVLKNGEEQLHYFAGYQDTCASWPVGTPMPEPGETYAGHQYDVCFQEAEEVLANFDQNFPMWAGRGYEIAGFVWWQGHKDSGKPVYRANYTKNLVQLIQALREQFDAPDAPFVVGTVGFYGFEEMGDKMKEIANAQLAVSDYDRFPQFKGNVKTVETRGFWKPAEASPTSQGFHYHQNGEVYLNVGQAFGKAMVELRKNK